VDIFFCFHKKDVSLHIIPLLPSLLYFKINMTLHIKYLTNEQGEKTDVQIPYAEWAAFERDYQRFMAKMQIEDGIKSAMQEVGAILKGKKQGRSLQSVIDEL
jgi:hypothetical protein